MIPFVSPPVEALVRRGHWLFDLDGTLVDSCPVHETAFREAIAEVEPEALAGFRYADHAGASTRAAALRLTGDAERAGRLARRKQELYREYVAAGRAALFPGARDLLDRLAAAGRTAYLVTGGSRASVERVLAACTLTGRFHAVLTSDDIPVSKPDPAVYATACERWGIDPRDAVVLEDSAHGVASAVGAGLATVHVHVTEAAPGAVAAGCLNEITSLLDSEVSGG